MSSRDVINYFNKKFSEFGEDEKSLGWTKKKQALRFYSLTKAFNLNDSTIVDVGCGFADLYTFIKKSHSVKKYIGIEVVENFFNIASEKLKGSENEVILGDFLTLPDLHADFVVGSGIFGLSQYDNEEDNYKHVESVFRRAYTQCDKGFAFDFISDKVDFRTSDTDFHASPSRILDIAYKFSKNVTLDNTYMPFEFTIVVNKDDSFEPSKTIFKKFQDEHPELIDFKF